MTLRDESDSPTPPRQLAREVIANLIHSSTAPPDITAKAIMQTLEKQGLALFASGAPEQARQDAAAACECVYCAAGTRCPWGHNYRREQLRDESDYPRPPPGMYYGPDGARLTMLEWAELLEARHEDMSDDSWWRRRTVVGDLEVSTVWLGLNHHWGSGAPLYWETMIFPDDREREVELGRWWRYSSRPGALDDHERIVADLRAGREPE